MRKHEDQQKKAVSLYLHPDDRKRLESAGPRRQSAVVALALAVLELAHPELLDRARAKVARRDAA